MATATAQTTSSLLSSPGRSWPMVAGFAYVGAWVLGLAAFGAGPAADASEAEIVRYFADHRGVSAAQSLLVHGVAALALYAVLVAVARTSATTRIGHTAGVIAVALSLAQCGLDLWRSLVATGSTTATLVDVINRIDGFKMLALAVMIGATVPGLRSARMIGRRMAITGRVAAAALIVSGIAYAGAITSLVASAGLSLVLLLIWVGYLGIGASRQTV